MLTRIADNNNSNFVNVRHYNTTQYRLQFLAFVGSITKTVGFHIQQRDVHWKKFNLDDLKIMAQRYEMVKFD